ncbi:MAG: cation diffusion facilitator family transporter [Bacillota bacterium]
MNYDNSFEVKEKRRVAFTSVTAAVVLTLFKLIVGISTNSLGILSEAAHSGLDLVAAFVTFLAVKASGKPADEEHHFGHGKVESISALFETFLLLITCIWIIKEVINRLLGGNIEIEVTIWSFIVVITSIAIDISRTIALKKVAKKYNSQALEADAAHFSTDILSSFVVLIGLISYNYGFHYADSIAALIVSMIVIYISFRLGRTSINTLLDRAPEGMKDRISLIISQIPEVFKVHDIKVRNSGGETLVELKIHVSPGLNIEKAHQISHEVESRICNEIEKCEVLIHVEPEDYEIPGMDDRMKSTDEY